MTQADRVHSTPPTNTSPLRETNPPPAARAESVDSFSHQPATGQPETGKLTSESGKPANGLSRRTMLGAIAVLPACAAVPAVAARSAIGIAPTELVARFELLLDEYYARQSDWGPRLAQAHAETDERFGEL